MIKLVVCIALMCICVYSQQGRVEYSVYSDTVPPGRQVDVDSVFMYVQSLGDIVDFDDCNICKSRAHILSGAIEKNFPSVSIAKVWLVADCKRSSKAAEYKYKQFVFLHNKDICNNWVYHVAPVIITSADTFVIDPATQTGALSLGKWADSLIPQNGSALLIIKDRKFYIYPDDKNNNFEDMKHDWNNSDEPVSDDDYSRAIDEVTRAKLGLIEPWRMQDHITKLKKLVR